MADSAPLLSGDDDVERTRAQSNAFTNLLKGLNLVVSGLALAILVTAHIFITKVPVGAYPWWALDTTRTLAIWMLVSLILCAINVALNIHNLINIVVDIIFASGITPGVFNLIDALPQADWCRRFRYPPYPSPPESLPVDPKCEEWKVVISYLMIAASVFAGVVAIIYFLLLILRAIALIKSKFWRRFFGSNFRLGPGEISLTFSLKFSQPQGASVEQHHDEEEAGPSSGRGAVYI